MVFIRLEQVHDHKSSCGYFWGFWLVVAPQLTVITSTTAQ